MLAHELAHICRNDFMSGLAGQISLTLHFYNPLAHWLAARLRLEQELAADAWGTASRAANNPISRRSRRWPCAATAVPSPGRPELSSLLVAPSSGELKCYVTRAKSVTLLCPPWRRLFTIGVLCALGLLVAGVRGPMGLTNAQAQPPQPTNRPLQTPTHESYNLAFLPADARMIVAVRPRALLERPEMKPVLEAIKRSPPFNGALTVLPEDVEQLILFWEGVEPSKRGRLLMVPFPSGGVLRTSKPQDWKSLRRSAPGLRAGSPSRRSDLSPNHRGECRGVGSRSRPTIGHWSSRGKTCSAISLKIARHRRNRIPGTRPGTRRGKVSSWRPSRRDGCGGSLPRECAADRQRPVSISDWKQSLRCSTRPNRTHWRSTHPPD